MKTFTAAAVLTLLAGCAHAPQVNRETKADKYAPPRVRVVQPKPQGVTFKDRWFEGVKTYATVFK